MTTPRKSQFWTGVTIKTDSNHHKNPIIQHPSNLWFWFHDPRSSGWSLPAPKPWATCSRTRCGRRRRRGRPLATGWWMWFRAAKPSARPGWPGWSFPVISGRGWALKSGEWTYQAGWGGLEHGWIIFPFSWEFHHPNWRTHIFQRVEATNQQENGEGSSNTWGI